MLTGSVNVGSIAPCIRRRCLFQINVLVDEKETMVFKSARESLSLLLCGGRGRRDVTLRQPCYAVRRTLSVMGERIGNLRRKLGCQPSSFGLDCSSESCKFDDSWRYRVKVKLLFCFV